MRALLLVILLLASSAARTATLRDVLEQAWERTPQGQALKAHQAELMARQRALEVPWAGSPSASLGYRSDRIGQDDGAAEWEAEVGMPIWLPGERSVHRNTLIAEQEAQITDLLARRLELAGQLREAVWAAKLAESALTLARQRVRDAEQLEQDVARRLKAGEVARTDHNLALSDLLTARSEEANAVVTIGQAVQAFATLTGSAQLPETVEEEVRSLDILDDNPGLAAQRYAAALAQARLRQTTHVRRDNPELSVSTRWDRSSFAEPYVNVIGIRFRLPFSTDSRNLPAIASANAALIEAQAEYARTRVRIALEIEQARSELQLAQSVLEIQRQKQAVNADNVALAQKAYSVGEFDMVNLLRVRTAAFQAEQELARQQINVRRARARLNQARGVMP